MIALAAAIAVAVYAGSLANGFVYDDGNAIVANPAAHDPWAWRVILGTRSWFAGAEPTVAYRPLTTWTFAWNYRLHALDPWGYHAVNVGLHALVAALVVLAASPAGPLAAGLAGVLFAVHPIHTEAVANVVGRAELLAAAGGLGALVLLRRSGWLETIGAVLLYGLAIFSKENAVALLVLLPLGQMLASPRAPLTRRTLLFAALLVVTAVYFALRSAVLGSLLGAHETILRWQNPLAWATSGERVLTALWIDARALWLLAVPQHLQADYSYREIPLVTAVGDPRALVGIALTAALLAATIWSGWRGRPAFYWLAFGLCTWLPVSNVLVAGGTIFAERLLYLPSVAFSVLLGLAVAGPRSRWQQSIGAAVALGLVGWWSARTIDRVPVWATPLGFAQALVRDAPASAHAQHYLGVTYASLGRDEEAMQAYAAALAIDPANVGSIYNIGLLHLRHGGLDDALAAFEMVNEVDPGYATAWINRGVIKNQLSDFAAGLECADRAVALRPDLPNGFVVRGVALRGLGRSADARAAFAEAARLAPGLADAIRGQELLDADGAGAQP